MSIMDGQQPRFAAFVVAGLALTAAWGAAQSPPPLPRDPRAPAVPPVQGTMPRDRTPPPKVGTGGLSGRVVDGVTGNAIPRARVRLQYGPGSRGPVATDANGAFSFTGLPAGTYTILVEKSTYLLGRFPEPGRSLRTRFQPLMLRDGQVVEDLSVPLFRGGVIAGRVVDAHGDPLDGAQVSALRTPRGGRPTMAGTFQTNDLGEFRIPRLPAGRYLLRVRPQMQSAFQDPNASANPDPPLPQPVPTYFPNVAAIAQAQPIVLNRGETVTGIDMMLAEGTPTVVNGLVLNPEGLPIGAGNVMVRAGGTEAVGGFDMTSNASITPTGTFRLMLPPGDYVLEARAMVRQNPNQVFRQEDQLFGSMRLSVGGTPLDTVSIMVGKGATASGRVVFEGTTPPPPPPGGQVRVPLMNPDGPGCQGSAQATIGPDWTFKVEGLSGTCGASPQGMFGRWTLKAAIFKGQNIMEQLVTFDTGQHFDNVQIVVTDRRTQMDLRVTGDDGQTTREYVALVFPTDKAKWNQLQRFVRTYVPPQMNNPPGQLSAGMSGGRGAQPGAVRVGSVPPPERFMGLPVGEYYVIAIDDMDAEDSMDPAILERLISSAIRVPLTDEGPIEVPLRRYTLADLIR